VARSPNALNSSSSSTLIVGAGIAGLSLTLALLRQGRSVLLADRRPGAGAEGVGILLTGNAAQALAELGLGAAAAAAAERVAAVDYCDRDGQRLFELDLEARPGWGTFLCMHRHTLQQLLLAAVGTEHVRWGAKIVDLEEAPDDVMVRWDDGTTSRHALVVGADGVHSDLRRRLFGEVKTGLPGLAGWRFLARCPAGLQRPQYMLGNGCTLLLHPLPGGDLYCGAGPADTALLVGGEPLEQLRRVFGDFGGFAPAVLAQLSADTPLLDTTYHCVQIPSWRSRRCVLVGDAAHACPPTLSQGGAMALEDGLVLARHLATEPHVPTALAGFEEQRRPRVSQALSASLDRMFANRLASEHFIEVRNTILRAVGAEQLAAAWGPLMADEARR